MEITDFSGDKFTKKLATKLLERRCGVLYETTEGSEATITVIL